MNLLNLDIRTILLMLCMCNIASLILLFSYKCTDRHRRPYYQFFTAKFFFAISYVLLLLRNHIPDLLSVAVANSFIFISMSLDAIAISSIDGVHRKRERAFVIITGLGIIIFSVLQNSMPHIRVGISSLVISILLIGTIYSLTRTPVSSYIQRLILALYSVLFVIFAVRAIAGFTQENFTLMTPNMVQTMMLVMHFMVTLSVCIGFILMLKERDDRLLNESESIYRTLVENAAEAIVIIQDERLVFINHGLSEFLGLSNDEILNRPLVDLISPVDRELAAANYTKTVQGQTNVNRYDFRLIDKNDKEVWVSITMSSVLWKNKPATMSLLSNINTRKKLEIEREQMILDLQNAISEKKILCGLLPICSSCKKIRDDTGYWNQLEMYIREHSLAEFSHGICPDCIKKLYPGLYEEIVSQQQNLSSSN